MPGISSLRAKRSAKDSAPARKRTRRDTAIRPAPEAGEVTHPVTASSSPATPTSSAVRERSLSSPSSSPHRSDSEGNVLSEAADSDVDASSLHEERHVRSKLQRMSEAVGLLRDEVATSISAFEVARDDVERLLEQGEAGRVKAAELRRQSQRTVDVVQLNVGGTVFAVPLPTLLQRDAPSYFHLLLGVSPTSCEWEADGELSLAPPTERGRASRGDAAGSGHNDVDGALAEDEKKLVTCGALDHLLPLFRDEEGRIYIDRDPATFKYILDYLRGYRYFGLLSEEMVQRLKVDAQFFQLPGLVEILGDAEHEPVLQFNKGPGVSPERNRLRVIYGVGTIGDVFFVTGKHQITFEAKSADYVGFGLVSDTCVSTDQEFHKTQDCCVYYMSGVFYTNFPFHRKEENLERIEAGDFVTIKVNMDKGYAEFVIRDTVKMISLGRVRRLRFAVTMKLSARVRVVPVEEVVEKLPLKHHPSTA